MIRDRSSGARVRTHNATATRRPLHTGHDRSAKAVNRQVLAVILLLPGTVCGQKPKDTSEDLRDKTTHRRLSDLDEKNPWMLVVIHRANHPQTNLFFCTLHIPQVSAEPIALVS